MTLAKKKSARSLFCTSLHLLGTRTAGKKHSENKCFLFREEKEDIIVIAFVEIRRLCGFVSVLAPFRREHRGQLVVLVVLLMMLSKKLLELLMT